MKKLIALMLCLCLMTGIIPAVAESENTVTIPYRFATKEEGQELLLANKEYYDTFSPAKLAYIMQRKDATMEEFYAFAREQVRDWTEEEKDYIAKGMKIIEDIFTENGWKMPPLDTIVFIRTTMLEENGPAGYTHGTQIYLGDFIQGYRDRGATDDRIPVSLSIILAHELFHCLTRCNPDFREDIYNIIGFTVVDRDYELPPSVWERFIANPDVEHHNSYATFTIDGKNIDCYTAFIVTKFFEKEGDAFFLNRATALVPVDGSDMYYTKEQASNFDEVFGKNTGYVIDPEECMADNFSFAVRFGMEGPRGDGYANPEIIEGIIKILSK